jgi:hypothetical protein
VGDKPEEPGPEPATEPDPRAGREQSFEEQRLVKLRERDAQPPEQGSPEPSAEPGGEQASPLPPDFRHGLMDEYRKRQQAAESPDRAEPAQQPPEAPTPASAPTLPTPSARQSQPHRRARK